CRWQRRHRPLGRLWRQEGALRRMRRASAFETWMDDLAFALALQRRVDNGEPLFVLLEGDARYAEHAAQLVVRHLHRAGRGRRSRRRLWKRGRARGVEGDVALDLLHHLVDVAVEHGDRAELLQVTESARAVLGAPAPARIDRPERDMGEHHDRLRSRAALDVVFQPFELLGAEIAEAAGLEVDDVDQADEMHAVGVKRIPAGAFGAAAVALAIELARLLVDDVVLARHVMHVESGLRDDFLGVVELRSFRQMRDVAGVDHEGGPGRQRLDATDRLLERAFGVGVGGLVEAHVAVADLQEGEARGLGGERLIDHAERSRHAAGHRPEHAGARPGHAFQHLAAAWSVVVVVVGHGVSPWLSAGRGLDRPAGPFIPGEVSRYFAWNYRRLRQGRTPWLTTSTNSSPIAAQA